MYHHILLIGDSTKIIFNKPELEIILRISNY